MGLDCIGPECFAGRSEGCGRSPSPPGEFRGKTILRAFLGPIEESNSVWSYLGPWFFYQRSKPISVRPTGGMRTRMKALGMNFLVVWKKRFPEFPVIRSIFRFDSTMLGEFWCADFPMPSTSTTMIPLSLSVTFSIRHRTQASFSRDQGIRIG